MHGARPGSTLRVLRVAALPAQPARGRLVAGTTVMSCALGPAGIVHRKREGDGATPAGHYRIESIRFRADRIARPSSRLPIRLLRQDDGWCDDTGCALYNRPVRRPFGPSHEAMWREDGLYDAVAVLDYNTLRIRKGRGSAIFLHVASPGYRPTAGCVAIRRDALLRLLPRIGPGTRILIG